MRFLPIVFMRYRKVPKVTTLVAFGFSSLPLSPSTLARKGHDIFFFAKLSRDKMKSTAIAR